MLKIIVTMFVINLTMACAADDSSNKQQVHTKKDESAIVKDVKDREKIDQGVKCTASLTTVYRFDSSNNLCVAKESFVVSGCGPSILEQGFFPSKYLCETTKPICHCVTPGAENISNNDETCFSNLNAQQKAEQIKATQCYAP